MSRRGYTNVLGAALAVLLVAGSAVVLRGTVFGTTTITASFTSATGIYPGDDIRVAGVEIGTVSAIEPDGDHVAVTLHVDRDVPIPAEAKAVIVSPNMIAARFVELTPAYPYAEPRSDRPTMADGATIPLDRTAVPVEWDEIKTQLMRLATELGPNSQVSTPAIARFIDSTANALDGHGAQLRETLAQLAGVGRILADGSGDIAGTVRNLQTLVSALQEANPQLVEFQGRLATLTSVLDDNRSDLGGALRNLSSVIGEVRAFISETRDKTSEQVQRLADVTTNLVQHQGDLEQLLHVTPNAIANGYADYNGDTGTILGSVSFNNFSNPLHFICAAIGAVKNTTAPETAKLCAEYLGPALDQLTLNNLPFPINPVLAPATKNLIYTDPALVPGGAGGVPVAAEAAPSVSAFTGGGGDVAPPPGWAQAPGPPNVDDMLLPDTAIGTSPP